jgi:6-phosphogluconolactonase
LHEDNVQSLTVIPNADDAQIVDWITQRLLGTQAQAICVPGGSTPFPIFAKLAATSIDWSTVTIWPGDDRMVEESHPASNVGRIRAIFEPVGAEVVALRQAIIPTRFRLVWLGLGSDGHIASLFPNTNPMPDDARLVRRIIPEPLPPDAPFERLTLTIPALLNCAELMIVARGDEKRNLFEAAAAGKNDLPIARLLAVSHQPVTFFGS